MASRLTQEAGFRARMIAPTLIGILLIIVMTLPFGSGTAGYAMPHLMLIHVYYYTLNRPLLMPPPVVAGLGLLTDMATGGPLGVSMVLLLLVQMLLINQQSFFRQRHLVVTWGAFVLICLLAFPVIWLLAGLHAGRMQPVGLLVIHGLATIAAYPFLYRALDWFQTRILD